MHPALCHLHKITGIKISYKLKWRHLLIVLINSSWRTRPEHSVAERVWTLTPARLWMTYMKTSQHVTVNCLLCSIHLLKSIWLDISTRHITSVCKYRSAIELVLSTKLYVNKNKGRECNSWISSDPSIIDNNNCAGYDSFSDTPCV